MMLYSQDKEKVFYSSNYNGLMLLKIESKQKNDYQYLLEVNKDGDLIRNKKLYKDRKEIKRWEYSYVQGILVSEVYYKDKIISEKYRYDEEKHKINQVEYKNGKKIRRINYQYNNEGLVELEVISNLFTKEKTIVRYKYDKNYKIKQIIKTLPDGRVIYWDSFFTSKGIIVREYYTVKNETYIFYYNTIGQEIKGEVLLKEDGEKKIKIKWENKYAATGLKKSKYEENFITEIITKTDYNKQGNESRIREFKKGDLIKITELEYDDDNRVIVDKVTEELNENEKKYSYDADDNVVKIQNFNNGVLKSIEFYNDSIKEKEIIYGENDIKIIIQYDKTGNIITQDVYKD